MPEIRDSIARENGTSTFAFANGFINSATFARGDSPAEASPWSCHTSGDENDALRPAHKLLLSTPGRDLSPLSLFGFPREPPPPPPSGMSLSPSPPPARFLHHPLLRLHYRLGYTTTGLSSVSPSSLVQQCLLSLSITMHPRR